MNHIHLFNMYWYLNLENYCDMLNAHFATLNIVAFFVNIFWKKLIVVSYFLKLDFSDISYNWFGRKNTVTLNIVVVSSVFLILYMEPDQFPAFYLDTHVDLIKLVLYKLTLLENQNAFFFKTGK